MEDLLEKFNYNDWENITWYQTISEAFMKKYNIYFNKRCWDHICLRQKLSEDFIIKFQNNLNWDHISSCQKLSIKFINKYKNKINWISLSCIKDKLSEELIRNNKDKFDYVSWGRISTFQNLNEKFISDFKDYLSWESISKYQDISESFIIKYIDKVSLYNIFLYQNINFSKKFILNNLNNIKEFNNNYNTYLYLKLKHLILVKYYIFKLGDIGSIINKYLIFKKIFLDNNLSLF